MQAIADNFDANISSQNGLKSTHALALLITQPQEEANIDDSNKHSETIKQLGKEEMKN